MFEYSVDIDKDSLSLLLLLSVNKPHVWNDPNNDLTKTSIPR